MKMGLLGRQNSLVLVLIILAAFTISQTVVLNVKMNPGPAIVRDLPTLESKNLNEQPTPSSDDNRYLDLERDFGVYPLDSLYTRNQTSWCNGLNFCGSEAASTVIY
jgi:hypothetical protein